MLLPTTLLHHAAPPDGVAPHHDWLILDPEALRDPGLGLWTARVMHHWDDWARLGAIELTPLPRHRRRYLDWAGTLSGQRGWVHPAGRGHVQVHLWTPGRIELTLLTNSGPASSTAPLNLSLRPTGPRWRGVVCAAET